MPNPHQTYGNCYWCNRMLAAPEKLSHDSRTRDHVRPKSQGGRWTVPACRKCNELKGDLRRGQWEKLRRKFPNYRKLFDTHREVQIALGLYHPVVRWPKAVWVPKPPLCRGLPSPWFRYGRNV